jgi:broad specificity phosphatase PhoE
MKRTMINTIYLIRHGENKANITHDFSYKLVDYPLTPKGVLQAEQTAEYFKDKRIDEIYASPLKRAKQTAEIIAQAQQLPVTIMEQFREINVGTLEGQAPTAENWHFHDQIVQDWFEGKYETSFPGGENYHELLNRFRNGLLEVTENKNGKNIIIVGHGGIFTRTMQDICPAVNMEKIIAHENYNCAITRIELHTEGSHIEGIMQMWAYYAHLHGEAAQLVDGTKLKAPVTRQI